MARSTGRVVKTSRGRPVPRLDFVGIGDAEPVGVGSLSRCRRRQAVRGGGRTIRGRGKRPRPPCECLNSVELLHWHAIEAKFSEGSSTNSSWANLLAGKAFRFRPCSRDLRMARSSAGNAGLRADGASRAVPWPVNVIDHSTELLPRVVIGYWNEGRNGEWKPYGETAGGRLGLLRRPEGHYNDLTAFSNFTT
jgi:hypothetical protein